MATELVTKPSSVDKLAIKWYGLEFAYRYQERTATEFQSMFWSLMERRHPGDFSRVPPWGAKGDLKCDGLLLSTRNIFQVYAPERMVEVDCVDKITTDFVGAKLHWNGLFKQWTFVHNSRKGLPPEALKLIAKLHTENDPPTVNEWGFFPLLKIVRDLPLSDLEDIFGAAPTMEGWAKTGWKEIASVLDDLETADPPPEPDLREPPPDKVAYNGLEKDAEELLTLGMLKAGLVAKVLAARPEPEYPDMVAEKLHEVYVSLRDAGYDPDFILMRLIHFVCGEGQHSSGRFNAGLAVVAHFFETCDIFERVPHGPASD